jgi:hypothetical protein
MRVPIEANERERAALAQRFGLIAVEHLSADYALRREAIGVRATGTLRAEVAQACVVTGEPCPARIEEPFAIRFLPAGSESGEDVELSEDALDATFFSGNLIDLGEAAAETMALALDPFPRSPAAAQALQEAGVKQEDEIGAFGALAGLKDLLAGKQ